MNVFKIIFETSLGATFVINVRIGTLLDEIINEYIKIIDNDYEPNMHSSDTKDIDIIKSNTENLEEFFTSSYEFSKKDFAKLNEENVI